MRSFILKTVIEEVWLPVSLSATGLRGFLRVMFVDRNRIVYTCTKFGEVESSLAASYSASASSFDLRFKCDYNRETMSDDTWSFLT